jgi:ABC-2 type transport system permease protein
VLNATLYITVCSMRNRLRRWVRRLREPRYLFGFIAAMAYLYFAVFARLRASSAARRRGARAAAAVLPALGGALPSLLGAVVLLAAAGTWLMPAAGRLLEFAPSEVQFLFPAPVPRRQLVLYRLLRSQLGLLLAAVVAALAFALPSGSAEGALRYTGGVWLLFVVARLYVSGVVLVRPGLASQSARLRRAARLPLAVVVVAALVVLLAIAREFLGQPVTSVRDVLDRVAAATSHGIPRMALWPSVAIIRPLMVAEWHAFWTAMAGSAVVAAAMTAWLLASDAVFQEAASGGGIGADGREIGQPRAATAYRARGIEWALAPTGRSETAFVWKSVLQMIRGVDLRVAIRLLVILGGFCLLAASASRARGLAGVIGVLAAVAAAYVVTLAPQALRLDLRQDLRHLELMKTWPIRGATLVRGEIAGPALALTLVAWALVALSLWLSTAAFTRASAAWRLSVGAGAMVLAPGLIFGQYTIHNAVALMFPAWVPLGVHRPRGLDAMGQRLLMLGGTWLALGVMVLPGAIVGGILWFAFYRFVGPFALVPAALACTLVMGLEILMMTEALGPAYERLDLLAIERSD